MHFSGLNKQNKYQRRIWFLTTSSFVSFPGTVVATLRRTYRLEVIIKIITMCIDNGEYMKQIYAS